MSHQSQLSVLLTARDRLREAYEMLDSFSCVNSSGVEEARSGCVKRSRRGCEHLRRPEGCARDAVGRRNRGEFLMRWIITKDLISDKGEGSWVGMCAGGLWKTGPFKAKQPIPAEGQDRLIEYIYGPFSFLGIGKWGFCDTVDTWNALDPKDFFEELLGVTSMKYQEADTKRWIEL